ncbi:hypothetical protein RND81_09G167900 [Saponaria officinalis]|uniref:Uncharacterized protein n=1 Tax=Saponaria officinalis TaxID=3572 RepID=A0AAW1INI8_SAPOF
MLRTRLPSIISNAKQMLKLYPLHVKNQKGVPKGHIAVYVGETKMKRFVVPLTYLRYPAFQDLVRRAEEEFDYNHPMGGLTILCNKEAFIDITSQMISY